LRTTFEAYHLNPSECRSRDVRLNIFQPGCKQEDAYEALTKIMELVSTHGSERVSGLLHMCVTKWYSRLEPESTLFQADNIDAIESGKKSTYTRLDPPNSRQENAWSWEMLVHDVSNVDTWRDVLAQLGPNHASNSSGIFADDDAAKYRDSATNAPGLYQCRAQTHALLNVPSVFFLVLKRFQTDCTKINKRVDIPTDVSLPAWLFANNGQDTRYDLTGVVLHSGASIHLGHYVAFTRDVSGQWYCCDDSRVTPASNISHALSYGYIYLFQKKTKHVAAVPKRNLIRHSRFLRQVLQRVNELCL